MAKLTIIALAAAALGIGGIALPSKHDNSSDNDASYASASVAEVSAPAFAAPALLDPFDRSAALCATGQYKCIGLGSLPDRPVTVREFFDNIPLDQIREINGWGVNEVTLDTIVPRRKMIAFAEKAS